MAARAAKSGWTISQDSRADWHRNIVSLRTAVDLFADLVDHPPDSAVLMAHELATKPIHEPQPILTRPFADADFYDPIASAIRWPFEHPGVSRYSDGRHGVWYGAKTLTGSIHETVHHFRRDTLASECARREVAPIVQERRVHRVRCNAALVDLRAACTHDPRLIDPVDYSHCQAVGAELRAAFLPGVLTRSARRANEDIVGVFVADALKDPRDVCYLTYTLEAATGRVSVVRRPGRVEWTLVP